MNTEALFAVTTTKTTLCGDWLTNSDRLYCHVHSAVADHRRTTNAQCDRLTTSRRVVWPATIRTKATNKLSVDQMNKQWLKTLAGHSSANQQQRRTQAQQNLQWRPVTLRRNHFNIIYGNIWRPLLWSSERFRWQQRTEKSRANRWLSINSGNVNG